MFKNSASIVISTCRDSIFNVEMVFSDVLDVVDEIIIVHQLLTGQDSKSFSVYRESLSKKYVKLKIIVDAGKGLSRSRNLGVSSVCSDLIFISDDDNKFIRDGFVSVRKYMDSNTSDVVIARIISPEGIPFKNYSTFKNTIGIKSSGSVSSIEMCIRKSFVVKNNIIFNEKFGLGTSLPSCEEFIYVVECIRASASIHRVSDYINIHPIESSGKNLSDSKIVQAKGAAFNLVFGFKGFFICIYFALKKSKNITDFIFMNKNILKGFFK